MFCRGLGHFTMHVRVCRTPRNASAQPSATTKGPTNLATTKVTKIRKNPSKVILFTFVIFVLFVLFVVQTHTHIIHGGNIVFRYFCSGSFALLCLASSQ
jgi:hypothetical protein